MKGRVWLEKGLRALFGLLILLLGAAAPFTCAASLASYPVVTAERTGGRTWLKGAFHVHTRRSDGRGTEEEVASAAQKAGLNFVVLTDHNDFVARPPVFKDRVLLIHAVEISSRFGHLVALGMNLPVDAEAAKANPVEVVAAAGGQSYLAHPVQTRNPWRDPQSAKQVQGLELYSADTFFREAMSRPLTKLLPALGAYFGRPEHGIMSLVSPQPGAMHLLLALNETSPRVALCAHDAHGLPRYEDVFRALALYLPAASQWPEDPVQAQEQVLTAIKEGQALCTFRALGEPEGFAWQGFDPATRTAQEGQVLKVQLPPHSPGSLRVQVEGAARLQANGTEVKLTEPGSVQVEVWGKAPGLLGGSEWKPWIVPSPIQVLAAANPKP